MTQRDVLVVLREELSLARATLLETELTDQEVAIAAQKLTSSAEALELRIRAPFDALLLERAAKTFRTAMANLERLLAARLQQRRGSPEVERVLKRAVVHAREIARLTTESGGNHVAAAIDALARPDAWSGATLDALVALVDTLYALARLRLGPGAHAGQLNSLVDRASSTAVVTSLHALKDLSQRAQSEPTVMKDRFQLDAALKGAGAQVVERLASWFRLDEAGTARLQRAVEVFTRRLLDRLTQR